MSLVTAISLGKMPAISLLWLAAYLAGCHIRKGQARPPDRFRGRYHRVGVNTDSMRDMLGVICLSKLDRDYLELSTLPSQSAN